MGSSLCRLYLVTPPILDPVTFVTPLSKALDVGGVAYVQLRLKPADKTMIYHACDVLRPVVQERNVAFIVNDHAQIAAQAGCDGVHIGQQDDSYAQARSWVGEKSIVGVTCHDDYHLAVNMATMGANYVAFGAFFFTTTKLSRTRPSLELLSWWQSSMSTPCVAIGGIKPENCAALVRRGAPLLAVMSGIWNHPTGPAEAVHAFNDVIRAESERMDVP